MTSSIDWEEIEEGGGNIDMRPPRRHRRPNFFNRFINGIRNWWNR